jgi:spore maturation protein CgeB
MNRGQAMKLKNQNFSSVLVTSTMPDRLNNNVSIRDYVINGFEIAFPQVRLEKTSIDAAPGMIQANKPELVLAIGSLAIDSIDFWSLRRACDKVGAVLAFWLHDDPYEFDYSFKVEGIPDVVFTNDAWALEHYQHPNVYHLPMAGCEKTHFRPIEDKERPITGFFCGVGYPNRVTIFRQAATILNRFNTVVLGDNWPSDLLFAQNTRIDPSLFADYAADSLITFNIGRYFNIANQRYALMASTPGPRTFEVALAGSAQLFFVDSLEVEDYLESDLEIILFDSMKDIEEVFQRAVDEPEWVIGIARQAQQRALKEHCYHHRVDKIMEACYYSAT